MPGQSTLDIPYGEHPQQTLDLFLPEQGAGPWPVYIHIHGGGFRRGDKANLREPVRNGHLDAGVAVASVNYRLSDQALAPAAMHDAARAVQWLRYHRTRYNLDSTRFAAGGPSAGAGISLWLAFHADLASRDADDAVARESTRLSCVVGDDAQCSYDPRFIRDQIGPAAVDSEGLLGYFGITPDQIDEPEHDALFRECSPLAHLDASAPPVLLWYWTFDVPRDETLSTRDGIHHPQFGRILKGHMDELGVQCDLHLRETAPQPRDNDHVVAHFDRIGVQFVHEQFGINRHGG